LTCLDMFNFPIPRRILNREVLASNYLSTPLFSFSVMGYSYSKGSDGKTGSNRVDGDEFEDGDYCQNEIDDDGDGIDDDSLSFYPPGTAETGSIYLKHEDSGRWYTITISSTTGYIRVYPQKH